MTGEIEAVGDIATAALAARAVEPAHGEGVAFGEGMCLNCGTALLGPHCHICGQAGHVHRSLAAIWHDLAHGVFHFEGKIWRTLPMLAWRPGELTRRYIAGERARFVSPMALFLFTVFLMFAVISAVGGNLYAPAIGAAERGKAVVQFERQLTEARAKIARLNAERAAAVTAGRSSADFDAQLERLRSSISKMEEAAEDFEAGTNRMFTEPNTGWAKLDKGIAKANANPNLVLYKIQSSAYKFSWALIPISLPFMWLLFVWRRGVHLYDHAIFVIYSLSFMTLLTIVLTLLGLTGLPGGWIAAAALSLPPLHMYRQLRGAYRLRRFSAIWRTVMLVIFCSVSALLFVLLLLTMGLLG